MQNVVSPFLEGYEQINQNNPATRGSTALVRVSKSTSYQTEISDEEIEKVSNTLGDDYYVSELIMWEKGAKWYREQLKSRQ